MLGYSGPIIVIGGSSGATDPLRQILAKLTADFPAPILVVVHLSPETSPELLDALLRGSPIPSRAAGDGDRLEPGQILIAPADHHLMVRNGYVNVIRGPRENRARPAIDPTLRTAARAYGRNTIAVILSGALNDGSYGALVVKNAGGTVIVQNPAEAEYPSMPRGVFAVTAPDHMISAAQIGGLQDKLVRAKMPQHEETTGDAGDGRDEMERVSQSQELPEGDLSQFSCPECGGPLTQRGVGPLLHYRCHTGHAFTGEVLISEQQEALESALWSAVRVLDEHAMLLRNIANQSQRAGGDSFAKKHSEHAAETEEKADLIRKHLLL